MTMLRYQILLLLLWAPVGETKKVGCGSCGGGGGFRGTGGGRSGFRNFGGSGTPNTSYAVMIGVAVILVLMGIALCVLYYLRRKQQSDTTTDWANNNGGGDDTNGTEKEEEDNISVSEADSEPFELSPEELAQAQIPEQPRVARG
jgi:preprotein translocase subunit SecG